MKSIDVADGADEAILHVRDRSVCDSVGSDALLVLEIAARLLGGTRLNVDGCPYHKFSIGTGEFQQKLCLFVSQQKTALPAESRRTPTSRFFGFVAIREDYLKAIRFLCLRLWADSGMANDTEGAATLFFPKDARSELPWGLESLWLESESCEAVDGHTHELVPDWYEDALSSLSAERKDNFYASVSFAVLFVILHEIGHFRLGHFDQSPETHERELQADGFAICEMLLTSLSAADAPDADSVLVTMSVGIAAACILFHVMILKRSPVEAGLRHHNDYPTAAERFSQVFHALIARSAIQPDRWLRDLLAVLRIFLDIGSLHPAFAFVMGTGWERLPLDSEYWCVEAVSVSGVRHAPH